MNYELNMAKRQRKRPSLLKTGRGGALWNLSRASGTECELNFISSAKLIAKHPFHRREKCDSELKVANVFSIIKWSERSFIFVPSLSFQNARLFFDNFYVVRIHLVIDKLNPNHIAHTFQVLKLPSVHEFERGLECLEITFQGFVS